MRNLEYRELKNIGVSELALHVYSVSNFKIVLDTNNIICVYMGSICDSNFCCHFLQSEIEDLNRFLESLLEEV